MKTEEEAALRIWQQKTTPVVYRQGRGAPLLVKLPYAQDNREWLRGDKLRKPQWIDKFRCWEVPSTWFDEITRRLVQKYGRAYVIQAFARLEKCAPACWNAKGFQCGCSCMGQNHGSQVAGNWWIISETCAISWQGRELSCKLVIKKS
jgi:hypothetical protein